MPCLLAGGSHRRCFAGKSSVEEIIGSLEAEGDDEWAKSTLKVNTPCMSSRWIRDMRTNEVTENTVWVINNSGRMFCLGPQQSFS